MLWYDFLRKILSPQSFHFIPCNSSRESNEEKMYFVLFCFSMCICVSVYVQCTRWNLSIRFLPALTFHPVVFYQISLFQLYLYLSVAVCLLCVYVRLINPCIGKLSVDAQCSRTFPIYIETQHTTYQFEHSQYHTSKRIVIK